MTKIIKWTPRIVTLIFIVFLSLFSLDVFSEYKFPEVLVALFMHLIPSMILVLFLIFAWKKPKWGGWPFIIAGLASELGRFPLYFSGVYPVFFSAFFAYNDHGFVSLF